MTTETKTTDPLADTREWAVRAENGLTCRTSEETARDAMTKGGYTLGSDQSPIVVALTRSGPRDEWTEVDLTVAQFVGEDALEDAGFEKRYRLCGHPGYPDPLNIHPSTVENATRVYNEYVAPTFEEYVGRLGHTPRRLGGDPYTAETFNPRILITWEFVGERQVFTPDTA